MTISGKMGMSFSPGFTGTLGGFIYRSLLRYQDSKDDQMVSQLRLVDFGYSCRSPEERCGVLFSLALQVGFVILSTDTDSPNRIVVGSIGYQVSHWSL